MGDRLRVQVEFKDRKGGGRGPVADAVLRIDDPDNGPLNGVEIHGFAVWRSNKPGQDFYASGPSREFTGKDGSQQRFNLFKEDVRLRGLIASEYRKENGLSKPVGERRIDEGRPEVDPSDDGDLVPF